MLLNNRCYERPEMQSVKGAGAMEMDMGMDMNACMAPSCPPVYECPQERVCHRQTVIEVPHVIPVNTRIINHQIYHHTFTPCYTCCEETEVCNVYDNNCCL